MSFRFAFVKLFNHAAVRLVGALAAGCLAAALMAAPAPTSINVTSILHAYDTGGNLLLTRGVSLPQATSVRLSSGASAVSMRRIDS